MPSGGDHRRTPNGSGPVKNALRYRSPLREDLILPERREPIGVNTLGAPGTSRTLDHLTSAERERFEAQLAAWRAGCALIAAVDFARLSGHAVVPERVDRWHMARGDWHYVRKAGRQ